MSTPVQRIQELLDFLYGAPRTSKVFAQLMDQLAAFRERQLGEAHVAHSSRWSEQDAILITYADQFSSPYQTPLQTLSGFLKKYLRNEISGVHLLPFYLYSSDDGFSVIDYREVNPQVGTWADIAQLGKHYRLMFDAVINHISGHSAWFQGYLRGEDPYKGYFIEVPPETDLSEVVRPRVLPLITPVQTPSGIQHVWTTFSEDQIDLNYANPQVLLEITDLLLFYILQGAEIIRLDAIGYLWKEIGTTCIHLPQTHAVIKLWRAVLDAVAPKTALITETNVPHAENVSYFGNGRDEAQLVYQFPLAPLVLHAFHTGDARKLTEWAATLETPSSQTTYFNFIASHDGIGVRPVEGLLSPDEIAALAERTLAHGGQVSYRHNPVGPPIVYELNITLFDALNDPAQPDPEVDVRRFLASQAILLSLAGVPGIYVHSLLGSRNCQNCVKASGRARSINREKFELVRLESTLADPHSSHARVLSGYLHLLRQRRTHPAFHPNAVQEVLSLHKAVFILLRTAPRENRQMLCLVNCSNESIQLDILLKQLASAAPVSWRDLLHGDDYRVQNERLQILLHGYQTLWLTAPPE